MRDIPRRAAQRTTWRCTCRSCGTSSPSGRTSPTEGNEPMETKWDDASPTQEVQWETGWRERSRNNSVQDQEIIDQDSLKGVLRSDPRSTILSSQKKLFEVQFGQQFSEYSNEPSRNPFRNIPETTQTSFWKSGSERRDGK